MRATLLIAHLVLIAVGTGMSFANLVNLRLAAAETGAGFAALALLRRQFARVADIVIALIWLTGIALAWRLWSAGADLWTGWFAAKLAFVVVLTLSHGLARATAGRMARSGERSLIGRIEACVAAVFVSALAAIALAVMAFG